MAQQFVPGIGAQALEGTRVNIYTESRLAMVQGHKCLIVLAAQAGTRKASGAAVFVPLTGRELTGSREWTLRNSSHTWMDPHRVGGD